MNSSINVVTSEVDSNIKLNGDVYLDASSNYFDLSIDYILGLSNDRSLKKTKKGLDLAILGKNIKEIRIKNNLSQENMAKILNVSQACIVKYEKGLIYITIPNLYKISQEFNVSINSLCGKDL